VTKKIILGALVGGLIVFVWGAVSWMVLPWHEATLGAFGDEQAVADVVRANAASSGVYFLPNMHAQTQGGEAAEARYRTGPLVFAAVRLGGAEGMGAQLLGSLIIQVLAAGFLSWLLLQMRTASYAGRLGVVAVVTLFASVAVHLPYWNWWHFSAAYTVVAVADLLIGWLAAGLFLARITAPRP
jgi:hypothetical protein